MRGREKHDEWTTRTRFVLGDVVRGIDHDEAEVLLGWLGTMRTLGARDLEQELREQLQAAPGPGEVHLDPDSVAALCEALDGPDTDEIPGLKLLRDAFCSRPADRASDAAGLAL